MSAAEVFVNVADRYEAGDWDVRTPVQESSEIDPGDVVSDVVYIRTRAGTHGYSYSATYAAISLRTGFRCDADTFARTSDITYEASRTMTEGATKACVRRLVASDDD